jgi:hypothetical protein
MPTAHLVGFDLRLEPAGLARAWTHERRSRFLLRDTVGEPLSVDPMIWPSRFWQPHVPPGMGIPQRLDAFAAASRIASLPRLLVALLAWPGDRAEAPGGPGDVPEEVTAWPSLGFDVADGSLVSGLVNCGYEPTEREALAEQFGPRLNPSGLLKTVEAAFEFRDVADVRVAEHAPFMAFELRSPGPS